MNIHHLELFYFVAKHGGIAAAVRNIPYGIQQPAVSGQIARLEESLGTKLFQRRPFALSPAGVELFEFIKPFFDNVEIVSEKLRQNRSPQLRIAAPSIVLHDYIPRVAAEASDEISRISPLSARSGACRSRKITPGPRCRSCDHSR
jgi:DNA-binding transcriptional LysR family regulator